MNDNALNQIFDTIKQNKSGMIDLQKLLTGHQAIAPESGGDGEGQKADALISYLNQIGFSQIDNYPAHDKRVSSGKRPNLVLTIPGRTEQRFWIMTHLDVVPPGELSMWKSPPFEAIVKGGKIYGRGVEDNQQGMVASIFAAKSILDNNMIPHFTVKLLFVADEEVGSEYGIKYLLKNCPIFKKEDFFLVPDIGNKDGTMIELAEKNMTWLKFRTHGKQCHASVPELGKNAFVAASELVFSLNELNQIFNQSDNLFSPPVSTFSPTKKEANVPNINTIPGDDIFYMDCRILPSVPAEEINQVLAGKVKQIEQKYGVTVEYKKILNESSRQTSVSAAIVTYMKQAIKKVYGVEGRPMGVGGGTVAAFLRNYNYDTAAWSKTDISAHMPNEYCILNNLIGDAQVMAAIMMGIGT